MNLSFIKPLGRYAGRTALLLRKYSPQLLMGAGAATGIGSTVLASMATLHAEEVLEDMHADLDKIAEAHDTVPEEKYPEQDYKQDLLVVYTRTAVDFAKLYGPALALGAISLTCFFSAHKIMIKRQAALMATYKILNNNFSKYRDRVIADVGKEKDLEYRGIGSRTYTVQEQDDDGNMIDVPKTVYDVKDPNDWSPYAKFFDAGNPNWKKNPEYNLAFLKNVQSYCSRILEGRGHLLLNEVYRALGIPENKTGMRAGWIWGAGDNFVDFGIYDIENAATRDFVNGYEATILLDFNCDGDIYDLVNDDLVFKGLKNQ